MNEIEDIKLQAFLQNMKLDSPEPNFSVQVMNKIFEENSVLEKIKSEKILGKGFWIIFILFIALLAAVFILYNTGVQPQSQIEILLSQAETVSEGYQSFFNKMGSLPLAIGGILAAFSVLLFIDRFISLNSKVFA